MELIDAAAVRRLLPWDRLIEAIRQQFAAMPDLPLRQHLHVPRDGTEDATLLLMPAWRTSGIIGTKVLSVFPGNAARNLPSISAVYLIQDGETGTFKAVLEGAELTARRTAAASALAARYLARPDSRTLLCFGAGALARRFIAAHASVRPIERVLICNRTPDHAQAMIDELILAPDSCHLQFERCRQSELARVVPRADIISCTTMASEPLFEGRWVSEGAHIDLAGAHRPDRRESDDVLMSRAGLITVDSREGALAEGGDIVQAMASGAISEDDIRFDLAEMSRGDGLKRESDRQITLFKSVGHPLMDYAAASLIADSLAAAASTADGDANIAGISPGG